MSELVSHRPIEPIVVPTTGELVNLAAPTAELAVYLDAYRELDRDSRRAKTAITDEIAQRLDHDGRASETVTGWKVTVNAPDAVRYDADAVYAILVRAAEAGAISASAVNAACPEVVTRKVSKRDLDRIAKVLPVDLANELRLVAKPEARRVSLSRVDS